MQGFLQFYRKKKKKKVRDPAFFFSQKEGTGGTWGKGTGGTLVEKEAINTLELGLLAEIANVEGLVGRIVRHGFSILGHNIPIRSSEKESLVAAELAEFAKVAQKLQKLQKLEQKQKQKQKQKWSRSKSRSRIFPIIKK